MEFLENYDCTINYYPGKVNVVADALSWKSQVVGLMIKKWDMLGKVSDWKSSPRTPKSDFWNYYGEIHFTKSNKKTSEKNSVVQK